MCNNTASQSPSPAPPPLPKFEFLPPTVDAPRLEWADWLCLVADQLAADYPGRVGLFVSAHIGALAIQARALGAHGPDEHERLAAEAAAAEAAWVQALEAEAMSPGIWTITVQDESSDDTRRGWFTCDSESETNRN